MKPMRTAMLFCVAAFGFSAAPAPPAMAQQAADNEALTLSRDTETIFRADEVVHHADLGVTVLRGNVEIAQQGRVLTADTISYNREANTLTASGDVVLMEPSGNVVFSSYAEITSDGFKNGIIENIRILMQDNARVAANGARRSDGNRTDMVKGVYSPCGVCKGEEETGPPLWQVKARRIIHDDRERTLEYEDAWLEVGGVPVLYTPYFQHYDPRVDRKSGLLLPSFGSTSGLGSFVQPRYFWAVAPNRDVTFSPVLSDQGEGIFAGQYRQAFDRGELELNGSLGYLKGVDDVPGDQPLDEREARGHVIGFGRINLDDTWRAGFDLERQTDKTYNQAYPLFEIPSTQLVSRGYVEGFRGRNYAVGEMLSIQSLRVIQPRNFREQDVIPRLRYNGMGEADRFGGRWQFDTEARFIAVDNANDTHRLSVMPGYGFTKTSDLGFKSRFLATLQGNGYLVEEDRDRRTEKGYEFEGLILPKSSMEVSYPLVRYGERTTQTVEPLVFGTVAPEVDPPEDVALEDSATFELDETNIFSHERLNGRDVAEGGSRVALGTRYRLSRSDIYRFDATVGRIMAATENDELARRIGNSVESDDWVGALQLSVQEYLSLGYRFRRPDLSFEKFVREEVDFSVGTEALRLSGNYTFVDDAFNGGAEGDSEFTSLGLSSRISESWRAAGYYNYDFTADDSRSFGASLEWRDTCSDCARVEATWSRTITDVLDRGRKNDTLKVLFTLRTLGEYGLDF